MLTRAILLSSSFHSPPQQFPLCVPSRYILLHYYKCRDKACLLCGPVHEAITHRATLPFLLVGTNICQGYACFLRTSGSSTSDSTTISHVLGPASPGGRREAVVEEDGERPEEEAPCVQQEEEKEEPSLKKGVAEAAPTRQASFASHR